MVVRSLRDSTLLIAEANSFLDRLERPKTMKEIETNLRSLTHIKDEMMAAGFNATFPELMLNLKAELTDEELPSDISKQLRSLREFANLKKYTLNRVKIAIASHNILYNMLQRGTVYPFAEYLPYDGQYLYDLIYLGEPAIRAYNAINTILSQKEESKGGEYTVVISIDGKKQKIKLDSNQNLGERVKRVYGDGATILSITKRSTEKPLVNGRSNRVAIASAYARLATTIVYPKFTKGPIFTNEIHKIYSSILSKHGLSSETRIDLIETREELEDELYSKKLLFEQNNVKILHPDVVQAITKNRKKVNRETVKEAERLLSEDIFYFFMTESKKTRTAYPLFKGISGEVDARLSFLNKSFAKNSIEIIKEKITLESLVPTSSKELAAVLMLNSGKSKEWCMQKFNLSEAELDAAKSKLSPYLKNVSSQAKEFLDLLRQK
ncbi:MAG: DUF530 domain-containing protein [Candidatus Micrarchaeota archaeon]|nr:DUF530 domain-containing protein [Candidatus Micrarchaeota archaeon]